MAGIYSDPNAIFAPGKISGVPKATLDAFKTYLDTGMRATRDALKADIEKALGRSLNEGERSSQLRSQMSDAERYTLSGDTRRGLMKAEADEHRLQTIFRVVEKQGWDVIHEGTRASMSVEKNLKYDINILVKAAVNRIVLMKDKILSGSENLSPEMKAAFAPSSVQEVEQMRADMLAAYKEDIATGALKVTVTDDRIYVRRTDENANPMAGKAGGDVYKVSQSWMAEAGFPETTVVV